MKDLKHYFTENSKSCDTSKIVNEVTRDRESSDNAIVKEKEENGREISTSTSKKRGRVKIKITKNNTRGKICDIVESKSDLVDKTPSPFAKREINNDELTGDDDTPKRMKSCKIVKISNFEKISISPSPSKLNDDDENFHNNDNSASNNNFKIHESTDCSGSRDLTSESMENSSMIDVKTLEREESNAFQVLMMRKKTLQYKADCTPTRQDKETAAKMEEEAKNRLKRNKEKLLSLADKKGYSKRKYSEAEEAEKIEKRLEKRAKIFKQIGKKENDDKNSPPVITRRVCPGSLHNYFSKATPERRDKDATVLSRIVVEAEVHSPNSSISSIVRETTNAIIVANSNDNEINESLATMDVIQVLKSPDFSVTNGESNSAQRRDKKPRWSLRINLQCNDRDNEAGPIVESTEKPQRGRRDSKTRRDREKMTNQEEKESSDTTVSSHRSTRKKKSYASSRRSKNSSTEEIRSFATRGKISPPITIIPSFEKIETTQEINIIEARIANKGEKLAPLFVKRQKLDPAILEARRAFLHSVPALNEDRANERKVTVVGSPTLPFPTISHVTQLDDEKKNDDNSPYQTHFPTRQARTFVPKFNLEEFKSLTGLNVVETKNFNDANVTAKSNIEDVLAEIESSCSDAREIWTRISSLTSAFRDDAKKSPKRRGKKKKSVDKKIDNLTNDGTDGDCAWTEKYRPTSTRDIFGNEEGAEKFRKWLNGWRFNSIKDEYSSGDEFSLSDCSYASNPENNQVAVLLGPHGSGKTASVYAIAEELGYRVIEINASSKRAGKKILKELEEATKSHRIKRQDFTPLNTTTTSERVKKIPQNSLILVEDVDIVFEEDEGFVSATCQLASNTKRPIVMTGRKACPHLNRMAPRQIRIYYGKTVGTRVSAFLELVTIAETGYRLPRSCLDRLLQNGDLRRALLQLQYLLISGKPNTCEVQTNFHQSLWQDMRRCVYKPAIKGTKKLTKKLVNGKNISSSSSSKKKSIIESLADDMDKLSFLSTMIEVDDPAIEISSLKLEASLSLAENTHDYSSSRLTSVEIAKWLRDRLMNDEITNDCAGKDLQNFRQISLKKELNVGVNLALSQVSPHTLDRRLTMLDYLSSVRTICRAEEARKMRNDKRGNRFFHYLKNLRLPALSTRPNILTAACKMMEGKNSES